MSDKLRNPNKIRWLLAIPFAASLISMWHIVSFFELGNPNWMAIVLAITFEIAALASLVSFTLLDVLKGARWSLYFIFVVLFLMQIIGNIYYSFDYVSMRLLEQENWVTIFKEFLNTTIELFGGDIPDASYTKFIIASTIGAPIPLISLSYIHILVKYMDRTQPEEEQEPSEEIIEETDSDTEEDSTGKGSGVMVDY